MKPDARPNKSADDGDRYDAADNARAYSTPSMPEIFAAIAGTEAADYLVAILSRGLADPDILFASLQAVLVTGERERLRSWARRIQKKLEAR